MNENDLRFIVTLKAISIKVYRVWNRPHNRDRWASEIESDVVIVNILSREFTLVADGSRGPQIQLTFDNKSKNLEKEFVFESDLQKCDVLLNERDARFSRQHFRIFFNAREQVVFENTSREEAFVEYKDEGSSDRDHFHWILFDKYQDIEITMQKKKKKKMMKKKDELIFKIRWSENREDRQEKKYKAYRDVYLEECRNVLSLLS